MTDFKKGQVVAIGNDYERIDRFVRIYGDESFKGEGIEAVVTDSGRIVAINMIRALNDEETNQ